VAPWGDGGLSIAVSDDGPGIAADQQKAIFRKFGRGRETRRAGTGLGLFITRGLARAHGGDVVLESELGVGSTFTVTLPAGTLPGAG
jgi:signal transduction histidine kinase